MDNPPLTVGCLAQKAGGEDWRAFLVFGSIINNVLNGCRTDMVNNLEKESK